MATIKLDDFAYFWVFSGSHIRVVGAGVTDMSHVIHQNDSLVKAYRDHKKTLTKSLFVTMATLKLDDFADFLAPTGKWEALWTAFSQVGGAVGGAEEEEYCSPSVFFAITWIRFIGFIQNLAWTYYLTLGTSLRKNFSFFSKSKMAAGGQKFATRHTFSIFSWNPTFNIIFLYEGDKSPADKFALKNAEFCLVSKTVKYVFVRIF